MSSRLKTDWKLFSTIVVLLAIGLVMVYSASSFVADVMSYKRDLPSEEHHAWFAGKQLIFAVIGLALMLVLKRINYMRMDHPMWVFLPASLVMVALIGVIPADPLAHRWYRLGGLQIQPSEMAKPVLILFLAWFVARRENRINDRYTLLPAALVVGGMTMLIAVGDLGTAVILLAPAAVVFYVAGIERKYFYLTLALGFVLGIWFLYQKPYRILRAMSYVGLKEETVMTDPKWHWLATRIADSKASRDTEHQPKQARLAVGSGGITGVGLGQSGQKRGFLPEAHTDFIFGVIGEETGLVGSLVLLSGYLIIFWRGLRLYWLAPDRFGRYLALGCVSLVTAQALFNISVVLGLAPTKGIPLPLVSYGGSALICTLITFGLLLSVSDRALE
jgi:cell division protein FtsW